MVRNAFDRVEEWRSAREAAGMILLALDFDGTLAPIVPTPDEAELPDGTRAILQQLAARGDTTLAIISGREIRDLQSRVRLSGIYYAGNHGLEIEGPGVSEVHQEALGARPALEACVDSIRPLLDSIPGSALEDKGLTLSVHFRQVADPGAVEEIREGVRGCGADHSGLLIYEGKKVFEIRPRVEWHKGRATEFLLDQIGRAHRGTLPAIFIGDDRTDEDAFLALRGRGEGVIVDADPPPDTAALSSVASPVEVAQLLELMAQ